MLDWTVTFQYLPDLLRAAVVTIELTLYTVLLGTVIAIPLAILRQSSNRTASQIVAAYSWLMRTGPLLIIFFFAYYGLPLFQVRLPAFQVAVIGGGISAGAYYLEIIRAGLVAIPQGQIDAARALGLPPFQIWSRIVLPQAVPVFLPPYIANTQGVLKGSSLASIITVQELTGLGNMIISETYRCLEILLPVGLIYLALNSMLTILQKVGERHWAVRGSTGEKD